MPHATIAFSHVSAIPPGKPKRLCRHMLSAFLRLLTLEHSTVQATCRETTSAPLTIGRVFLF
jgi:hypothetical protein